MRTAGLLLHRNFFDKEVFNESHFNQLSKFQLQLHGPYGGSAKPLRLSARQFPSSCHHNIYRPSVGRATKAGGNAKHAGPATAPIDGEPV